MTGMNGRALADTLQATHAGLPVLYASGYTADVIARHGVLEPGISLIEKPYSGRALLQAVRRKIGR
jgi:FixJ family two-component response regulator